MKAIGWESGDGAAVQISTNGTTWTTVDSFADGFDDGVYRMRQVDLSAYVGLSAVYLRFQGQMNSTTDYFFVDSITISEVGGP